MVGRLFIPQIFTKQLPHAKHYSKCRGYVMNKTDQNPSLWNLSSNGWYSITERKRKEKEEEQGEGDNVLHQGRTFQNYVKKLSEKTDVNLLAEQV